MTYKKRFSGKTDGSMSPISGSNSNRGAWNTSSTNIQSHTDFAYRNYQSRLPEVYTGHPNRIDRYGQYENMDIDPEINSCLDIIAEFSTQTNKQNQTPFDIQWNDEPTNTEVEMVKKQLQQWTKINKFDTRTFKFFRNCLKYGDQVFIRDPETFELFWVDMTKVMKVIVNESAGKEPEQYVVKDINPNLQNLSVAQKTANDIQHNNPTAGGSQPMNYGASGQTFGGTSSGRFELGQQEMSIDAKHVVHLSLTEGLDSYWPFGQSILETIFKVFKQKELLEDAILIYRISRAPERRIFKIDVGNIPAHMAMAFVDRVKNEMYQRRIPSSQGGSSTMDATYSPIGINEDFFFPQTADGKGSSVETLPGGGNLGELDDLKYFNNKMARGLRIPSSYLPTGPDDAQVAMNDGRVGTAMIQEYRFNQYCERLQKYISQKLDDEFKLFLKWRGFNIDSSIFTIKFTPPQNFASYRQSELDKDRMATFQSLEQIPYISKRFAMERFLGLTKEEIEENAKLWEEENEEPQEANPTGSDMRSIGISSGDISADSDMAGMMDDTGDLNDMGMGDMDAGMDMGNDMAAPGAPAGSMAPPIQ